MRPRGGFFRVIRFTKSIASAKNAIRYAAFRSEDARGGDAIFDARSDCADVGRFMRDLDDPITRHPSAAKAYHALFSLSRQGYDTLTPGTEWRDVVRSTMQRYELETHRRLDWIAVEHNSPDHTHPHVHIVIKAAYRTEAGVSRRLRLDRNEISRIRDLTGRELTARGLTPWRPPERMERSPQIIAQHWTRAVGAGLAWLQEQIEADRRRRAEEEHDDEERERRRREVDRDR